MQAPYQSVRGTGNVEQSGLGQRLRCALWLNAGFVAASAAGAALAQITAGATEPGPALGIAAVAAWLARLSWQRGRNALETPETVSSKEVVAGRAFVQPIAPLSNG